MPDDDLTVFLANAYIRTILAHPANHSAIFAAMGYPDIRPWYNGGFLVSPSKPIQIPHPDDDLF